MSNIILIQVLEKFLNKFKAKNGFWYAVIMAILALVYFGLGYIAGHPEIGIIIPATFKGAVNTILIILAALVSADTGSKNTDTNNTDTNKNK